MASTAATTPQDAHGPVAAPSQQEGHSPAKIDSPQDSTPHASPSPPPKTTSGSAAPVRLPPGPRASAPLQTLAWAIAPTWVMDQCAKRLGEAFTLTFAPSGMKLVM